MKLTKSQLGKSLKLLAALNCKADIERNKIMLHCESVYGVTPEDIDNDEFIDGCDGGCGAADGMSAEEFHASMMDCMERAGIKMPNLFHTPDKIK